MKSVGPKGAGHVASAGAEGTTERDAVSAVALLVFFIATFLPYISVSASGGGFGVTSASASIDAWHSYATAGVLLVMVGGLAAAIPSDVRLRTTVTAKQWQWGVLTAVLVGLLVTVIRAITLNGGTVDGVAVSVGIGSGFVLMLLAGLVLAAGRWAVAQAAGDSEPVVVEVSAGQ
jgi:hypothetical protein